MSSSTATKGLAGNRDAAALRADDVLVVTHGRTFARTRATITGTTRSGAEIRVDYRTAAGATGHFTAAADERFTVLG